MVVGWPQAEDGNVEFGGVARRYGYRSRPDGVVPGVMHQPQRLSWRAGVDAVTQIPRIEGWTAITVKVEFHIPTGVVCHPGGQGDVPDGGIAGWVQDFWAGAKGVSAVWHRGAADLQGGEQQHRERGKRELHDNFSLRHPESCSHNLTGRPFVQSTDRPICLKEW